MKYDDYKYLDKLSLITNSIYNIYKNLYHLELKGLKNKDKYEQYIKYLQVLLEEEKEHYKKIEGNTELCIKYYEFIRSSLPNSITKSNIDSVLKLDCSNIVARRIIGKFKRMAVGDSTFIKNIITNFNFDITTSEYENYLSMNNELLANVCNELTRLLDEESILKENTVYIKDLFKVKYICSFLFPHFEQKMIQQQFNANGGNLDVIVNIDSTTNMIINIDIIEPIMINLKKILLIRDIEYNDKDVVLDVLMMKNYIKSLLPFLNSETILLIKDEVNKYTNSDSYLKERDNDKISLSIVNSILLDNKDKVKKKKN